MTKEEILQKLIPVISVSLARPEAEIVPGAKLTDDLGADSLDIVQLGIDVETEFDLSFTDAELEDITTVQHVVDLVHKTLAA